MANGMVMRLGVEEVALVLPVEASRRDSGVRQPVERDVVEDVVPREAPGRLALEDLRDEAGLAGAVAVVDQQRREVDRRVRQAVHRLRARRHDLRVGHVLRVEGAQLLVGAPLVGREAGRRRVAGSKPRDDLGGRRAGHVRVDAEQLRRPPASPIGWVTAAPQSPPCATNCG